MRSYQEFLSEALERTEINMLFTPSFTNGKEAKYTIFSGSRKEKFLRALESKCRLYLAKDIKDQAEIDEQINHILSYAEITMDTTGSIPVIDYNQFIINNGDTIQDSDPVYSVSYATMEQIKFCNVQSAITAKILPVGFKLYKLRRAIDSDELNEAVEKLTSMYPDIKSTKYNIPTYFVFSYILNALPFNMPALNNANAFKMWLKESMLCITYPNTASLYHVLLDIVTNLYTLKKN